MKELCHFSFTSRYLDSEVEFSELWIPEVSLEDVSFQSIDTKNPSCDLTGIFLYLSTVTSIISIQKRGVRDGDMLGESLTHIKADNSVINLRK